MILFAIIFSVLISSAISSNLCDFKKCKPNEMACAEIVPKFSTILCKCARYCKRLKLEELDLSAQVSSVIDVIDEDEMPETDKNSNLIAFVKQGGSACSPFTCFNGGVCYTSYNKIAKHDCSTPVDASPNCLLLDAGQPICSCQAGFSGEKCQLRFDTFKTCEIPNLCANGGRCITISENFFQCICPPFFAGKYCETSMYVPCTNYNNYILEGAPLCHPENGFCSPEGRCVCKAGYTGNSCSEENTNLKKFDPKTCSIKHCNGHGICLTTSSSSNFNCLCDSFYTGEHCDTYFNIIVDSNSTATTKSSSLIASSQHSLLSSVSAKRKLRNKLKRVKHKMLILNTNNNNDNQF